MNVKIAIVGDVHLHFNQRDVEYFNQSDYSLILFVGDLINYRSTGLAAMGKLLGQLEAPTYFIPGNHDGTSLGQLVAEVVDQPWLRTITSLGSTTRVRSMEERLSNITTCGYSLHPFEINGLTFDMVAARPHAMGGGKLSFPRQLKNKFGIASMAESSQRLIELVDQSTAKRILFLAHNGPAGLGAKRHDIWGCDFRKGEGDFGDPDLQAAIKYAITQGKEVCAVVAGHMHHALKGGGTRKWHQERDQVHYINAARVPRIEREENNWIHHHVRLELTDHTTNIESLAIAL